MHITFHPFTLHFKEPAGTSRGVYRTRKVWYVIVDGCGIGECAPLPDLSADALPDADYERVLAQACRLTEEAGGSIPHDFLRPYPSIRFGLETALLSYRAAQTTGSPYQLYDHPFSRGEKGIVINGLVWMGTYEEMMTRMEEKLSRGFRCIKIKIGAIDWQREVALLKALRERYPKEVVEIRVDANGGFAPNEAMERLSELANYDIHSIEQPIRQGQWQQMAELCKATPVPIALDEELIGVHSLDDKQQLLDTIRPQYIILKPSLHGGLKGCEEWIALAQQRGIGYWVTSALESNVGLNAIAQWQQHLATTDQAHTEAPQHELPQGLGTGQLFVNNYEAIHLDIKGQELWCGSDDDRQFQHDLQQFLADWHSEAPTLTVHTSGSTGTPKPLQVEKRRMAASALMTLTHLGLQPDSTALLCMPLRYIAGKMMVVRTICGHLRLRIESPTSHPLRRIAQEASHSLNTTPHFLAITPMQALATLDVAEERAIFESIPCIIIGGGSISPQLHSALQSCRGKIFSTYGMTETLSHIALRRLNGPEQSTWYTPLPGVAITTDAEQRLVIDAPALSPIPLTTNDIAQINERGEFIIIGRKDNIISSGGIKLSLEDLEARLGDLATPYQLTAVADPYLGQALTLIYTGSKPDDTTIAQRLTKYERPRHIIKVDKLPTTETGKPARATAQKMAEDALHHP